LNGLAAARIIRVAGTGQASAVRAAEHTRRGSPGDGIDTIPLSETSDMQPRDPAAPPRRRDPALTFFRHTLATAPRAARSPVPIVAALLAGAVLTQLVLGDELGVYGACVTLLLAAALFAILVVVDAGRDRARATQETYDLTVVALAALAIAAAVACLYLPLPWGGLGAAAVLVALLGALRLTGSS
jgi:hypothetical protein